MSSSKLDCLSSRKIQSVGPFVMHGKKIQNIPQFSELAIILGFTFLEICRFSVQSVHGKKMLIAETSMYFKNPQDRKDSYNQLEMDKLFSSLVMLIHASVWCISLCSIATRTYLKVSAPTNFQHFILPSKSFYSKFR